MSWSDDHMNAVSARWAQKYRESHMSEGEFRQIMKRTLLGYGWSEAEAECITKKAILQKV